MRPFEYDHPIRKHHMIAITWLTAITPHDRLNNDYNNHDFVYMYKYNSCVYIYIYIYIHIYMYTYIHLSLSLCIYPTPYPLGQQTNFLSLCIYIYIIYIYIYFPILEVGDADLLADADGAQGDQHHAPASFRVSFSMSRSLVRSVCCLFYSAPCPCPVLYVYAYVHVLFMSYCRTAREHEARGVGLAAVITPAEQLVPALLPYRALRIDSQKNIV